MKLAFIFAAILGLTGVIAGALGAHALEKTLTPERLDSYETAVRFQMYHSLLLLLLGILQRQFEASAWLDWSVYGIIAGVLLFSGSIYLLVLTPIKVGIVTPIGGLILIAGWGALLGWALTLAKVG